ncbi:hypothetical protein NEHOM01_0168 [Nematocida homosporus]|uniref:uncharacterized protein n=1 Tax=Nematocida homosporus TaxID=1912981 RepID=UPI00221F2D95|nr:uncharacterized protein NEHOM01_0168 [Nematocida homosporus]KAI5184423.1 hypothetical protein NEHOM01_0168 [Nematocida homosporus]
MPSTESNSDYITVSVGAHSPASINPYSTVYISPSLNHYGTWSAGGNYTQLDSVEPGTVDETTGLYTRPRGVMTTPQKVIIGCCVVFGLVALLVVGGLGISHAISNAS